MFPLARKYATHVRDCKIRVTLDDGREEIIDLEGELWGNGLRTSQGYRRLPIS